MKVLWVSPRLMGPAAAIISSDYEGASGNWIQSEYEELDKTSCKMFYLCGSKSIKFGRLLHTSGEAGEVYCIRLPKASYGFKPTSVFQRNVSNIINTIKPDIIHIWGTETCIQEAVVNASKEIPKVVFIQGIIGMHFRYRSGYITVTNQEYVKFVGLKRKIVKSIRDYAFKNQIKREQYILTACGSAIVDNDFTRAYCYSFDKKIHLYTRNLCAASVFREKEWKYDKCEKNVIFTIFGSSADKGLHQVVKAVNILKDEFPNIILNIPGPFNKDSNNNLLINHNSSSFERWMASYIRKNKIEKNVNFLGLLSPVEMANNISSCNVFVNPSCMEVHALSLREAMTVGAPCISSICGSVSEYLKDKENGLLYRYEEYEVLAYSIRSVLKSSDLASYLGYNARHAMLEKYRTTQKNMTLRSIYDGIIKREK